MCKQVNLNIALAHFYVNRTRTFPFCYFVKVHKDLPDRCMILRYLCIKQMTCKLKQKFTC